jgi:predicted hydrocarbon binding protein
MTIMTNDHSLVCSFKIGRGVLEGVQEIIGKAGVNAIFNLAHLSHLLPTNGIKKFDHNFSFEDLSAIQQALEELYGPRGGRGVALRSGRVFFKYFLRAMGDSMSMTTLDFRLLPTHQRVKSGLTSMASTLSDLCSMRIEVWEDSEAWHWQADQCPWCWKRHMDECMCHFNVGMLQEYMTWAGGGKIYHVLETECIARGGPACTIRIEKQPID